MFTQVCLRVATSYVFVSFDHEKRCRSLNIGSGPGCMKALKLRNPLVIRLREHLSPIHTARWSRKIARKLPECLLCERKHVPGLIPGSIPGWGPSNIAGFSPGTSAV